MKQFSKILFCLSFLFICTAAFGEEFSGTLTKDYSTKEKYNRVSQGNTFTIKNNSTLYLDHDLETWGNIIVEKGSALKATKDGNGFMEIHEGAIFSGVDFYYTLYLPDGTIGTRKIPMTLEEIWKSNNNDAKDYIKNYRFKWSEKYNGWIQTANARERGNPFNEDALINWEQIWDSSKKVNKIANKNKSILIKKNVNIELTDECSFRTTVEKSIILEDGASLTSGNTVLELSRGCTIKGLTVYCKTIDKELCKITDLDTLWKIDAFKTEDYSRIKYDKNLKAWIFDSLIYTNEFNKATKEAFYNAVEIVE